MRHLVYGVLGVYAVLGLILGGLAAGASIASAPSAQAACQENPLLFFHTAQKCDGPVQSDGTWQRCVIYYYEPPKSPPSQTDCHPMGPPGREYPFHSFYQPDTHIDP